MVNKIQITIYKRAKAPSHKGTERAQNKNISTDNLYNDVVKKVTEWPTRDYSIKTLAKFLGFNWRD